MFKGLCKDSRTRLLALLGFIIAFGLSGWFGQLGAIAMGAIAGTFLCRSMARSGVQEQSLPNSLSRRAGLLLLGTFLLLLVVMPILAQHHAVLGLFDSFYRAGALVFGGGHVVLPLLESATVAPGLVSSADFLAGYSLAQAVPGPLFTFAAWLGALDPNLAGWAGATLALIAIFLPGLLLVTGALPWWQWIASKSAAMAALTGINAAVVGVLAAAWVDPILASSLGQPSDYLIAAVCLGMLLWRKYPVWSVVIAAPIMAILLHSAGVAT
jgi:chromate transporter